MATETFTTIAYTKFDLFENENIESPIYSLFDMSFAIMKFKKLYSPEVMV